jgi:dTDP-4-amino-4,6-dideoxygalactose transaminase
MDPGRLETALTGRTKAIVPVHLYGQPANVRSILDVAARGGIPVVEDAAQAHGASIGGARAGSLGTVGCFSFYPTKNLGALGDGGMVVTSDPVLAERARAYRNYGQRERYLSTGPGINSRLDELQAAILSVKLPHLDQWNGRRQAIAAHYRAELVGCAIKLPELVPETMSSCHLFVVEVADRDRFRTACGSRGVATDVHYPVPIHLQPAFASLGYGRGSFVVAEALCERVVSLPMFPDLTDSEVAQVVRAVREAV